MRKNSNVNTFFLRELMKKDLKQKQAEKKTADKQLAIRQKELDWAIETRNKLCGTANTTTL